MLKRFLNWLQMRKNAARYGIDFWRRAKFEMPEKICNGRPVCFSAEPGIRNDFIDIFINDCYRLLLLPDNVRRILDIGGNVGFFSVAAKALFPNAIVNCYEPSTNLSRYLEDNCDEFGFSIFYEAVGGFSGTVALEFKGDSNQAKVTESEFASIPKISLDEAIARFNDDIDLLKIDCEGSEWEMFERATSWNRVSRIAMEYHNFDGQAHSLVAKDLVRLGFSVVDQSFDPAKDFGMIYAINLRKVPEWG